MLLATLLGLAPVVWADSVRYAVTSESWEPYWIVRDGKVGGILSDFMQALGRELAVELEAAHPLPPLRAQKQFREGRVQLECCVSMAWRSAPEQAEVSLWSQPVLNVDEVLVFPPGRAFPYARLEDLQGRTIATVRGYGYVGGQYFRRSDSPDSIAQLYKVAQGRSEAGIIDRLELAYVLATHGELDALRIRVEQGPVINSSELRIRVHRSRPDLLAPLDAAIARLRKDGSLARIVQAYAPQPVR